jgi:hypothetical protein
LDDRTRQNGIPFPPVNPAKNRTKTALETARATARFSAPSPNFDHTYMNRENFTEFQPQFLPQFSPELRSQLTRFFRAENACVKVKTQIADSAAHCCNWV